MKNLPTSVFSSCFPIEILSEFLIPPMLTVCPNGVINIHFRTVIIFDKTYRSGGLCSCTQPLSFKYLPQHPVLKHFAFSLHCLFSVWENKLAPIKKRKQIWKVKFFPVLAMKAYKGSRVIAPLILNLGNTRRCVVNFTLQSIYPLQHVKSITN